MLHFSACVFVAGNWIKFINICQNLWPSVTWGYLFIFLALTSPGSGSSMWKSTQFPKIVTPQHFESNWNHYVLSGLLINAYFGNRMAFNLTLNLGHCRLFNLKGNRSICWLIRVLPPPPPILIIRSDPIRGYILTRHIVSSRLYKVNSDDQ